MGSAHFHNAVRILRSNWNCFDCRRIHRRQIVRRVLLDCCRSSEPEPNDSRPHRMARNSVANGMVPIQCAVVRCVVMLAMEPVLLVAVVQVALRHASRNETNMIVRPRSCCRFRRILPSRIDDSDCPWCRSTNEWRNSDNYQLQLPWSMYLWLLVDEEIAIDSKLIPILIHNTVPYHHTYLYSMDIEPHNLLTTHSYSYFLHNQCSRRACICYHFVRNTNVLDDHHIYQLLFANYMCLLTQLISISVLCC